MPLFSISPAGQYGVISDVPTHETPLNSWTNASNMHFIEGSAEKVLGYRNLFGEASISPYFLTAVRPTLGSSFWIYAGATDVYAYDNAHNPITRAASPYNAAGALSWQGGVMNGLLYMNNGVDTPQVWTPPINTQPLVDLPNWPANTTASVIRSYKNFMLALDVTKSSVRDTRLVKWSHPASAGAYPSSWDETDPTKDAGEYSLAETEGSILDSLPLRDTNLIYKDDSIWGMSFAGGTSIFRFFNVFRNVGIMAKNCAVEFQTGRHFVFAKDDIFVHDGQNIDPIIRQRTRSRLYNALDSVNASNSFVVMDATNTEIWVCFPETGHTYCNLALIWNWRTNSIGFRDLPDVSSIGVGVADLTSGSDIWSSSGAAWDGDGAEWGQSSANPSQTRLVMASPSTTTLQGIIPDTSDADGTPFQASLERTGIGIPFKEGKPPDMSSMKFCTNIWPRITGTIGGTVWIRLGGQNDVNDAPKWGEWQEYVIGTTQKIDVMLTARLFAINFASTSAIAWKLQGYSLDVKYIGDY